MNHQVAVRGQEAGPKGGGGGPLGSCFLLIHLLRLPEILFQVTIHSGLPQALWTSHSQWSLHTLVPSDCLRVGPAVLSTTDTLSL